MFKNVPNTRFAHAAMFGMVYGLANVLLTLISLLFSNPFKPNYFVSIPVFMAWVTLYIIWTRMAMLSWRNQVNGGFISFGRAFGYYAVYMIVPSVLGIILGVLNITVINPMTEEAFYDGLVQQYLDSGMTETMAERMAAMGAPWAMKMYNPAAVVLMSVLGYGIMLLFGLIFAAVLKKIPQQSIPVASPQAAGQMEGYQQVQQQQQNWQQNPPDNTNQGPQQ